MDSKVWVYDIETLSNCFTYCAINKDTKEVKKYVIWKGKNDFIPFIEHLTQCRGMVGFNNLAFDYPVIHEMILNYKKLYNLDGDKIAKWIYKKAQKIIESTWSNVREEEVKIPQLDLFTIWHFNNRARITSLKKIEIAMDFENVQDMPIHHSEKIKTQDQVNEILEYNMNDIDATLKFYELTQPKINLRRGLLKKYGLKCLNYPDSKIGEELMLKLYCKRTGEDEKQVKKRRTHRKSFKFSECIPNYIQFQTNEFNELLNYLKNIEVNELKGSFKYSFTYKNFTFDLGTGGIHGCIKAGVYVTDNQTNTIIDADVGSLYPSLGITLGLYPEHLGKVFCDIYENDIVIPRLEAKKRGDKVMADGGKLSANSVYGKSNSEYSFLYDPLYTLKTTLAGQLALCMLSETIMVEIPNVIMYQINTDGLTIGINPSDKKKLWNIFKDWEKRTNLTLEYANYDKMIIRDVNSYIALYKDGKKKYKGALRPKEISISEEDWHKNFSQDIVTQAVAKYFLENIPVEKTITEHENIYDFCKMFNATHGWTCDTSNIEYKDINYSEAVQKLLNNGWSEAYKDGFFIPPNGGNMAGVQLSKEGNKIKVYNNIKIQQKTNRYYISNKGKTFRKLKDERIIEIEAGGTLVTMFNKFVEKPFDEYDINYQYYIDEAYKIIHTIDGTAERKAEEEKIKREQEKLEKEKQKEQEKLAYQEKMFVKYCVEKSPTKLQWERYKADWLIKKYGEPEEIR